LVEQKHVEAAAEDVCERRARLLAAGTCVCSIPLLREVPDAERRRRASDTSRVRLLEAGEQAEQGRLAGAVRADEPDPRTRRHDEVDIREDSLGSVRLRDSGRDERPGKARHAQRPPTTSASNRLLLARTGPDETGQSRIKRRRAPAATLAPPQATVCYKERRGRMRSGLPSAHREDEDARVVLHDA